MILRTRPLAPSATFDRSFDAAFDHLTRSFFDMPRSSGPVVDGTWNDGKYVLTLDLPGVPASAVDVSVAGTTLTIGVEAEQLTWKRSLRLGGRLSPDKISASHVDGRLTVTIGSHDEPTARQVEIDTSPPALEAAATDSTDLAADESAGESNAA